MEKIVLKAQNLSKRFGNQLVFKDFSFELKGPGLYAITGRNGSGKSTLIKILCGLLAPTTGRVMPFVNDVEVAEHYFSLISIATPYQELPEELSLAELVDFYSAFRTLNLPDTADLYKNFQLPVTGQKPIKSFSSGMKQRVRLGIAIYTHAPFLFLDEPTTNLDATGIQWYKSLIMEQISKKLIVVSSNHLPEEYPNAKGIFEIQ
ncbi:ABC transporter ATP-binding protein [Thermaurantimonas aggregans]|uniref:ABC transporter ATP-binding protein n=1 Tax=Thermaurantimonas aggregans TaxID=2173829 RepID=UPI0023F50E4E|nr:ABC transporter ATP-binding protein [Thermaurantimonas aggregans]MCX8149271.1 ABC transporter ATP-binding protein [Thermaurantimonas aggregans]